MRATNLFRLEPGIVARDALADEKEAPVSLGIQSLELPDLTLLSSVVVRCTLPFPQRALRLKDTPRVPRRNHQVPAEYDERRSVAVIHQAPRGERIACLTCSASNPSQPHASLNVSAPTLPLHIQ